MNKRLLSLFLLFLLLVACQETDSPAPGDTGKCACGNGRFPTC